MAGALYLVPNLLGAVPPADVLPARTLDVARSLRHWVVETPKPARAFLKSLGLPVPVAELAIEKIDVADVRKLLSPVHAGHDLGVLSDAGCPGVADPGSALVAAAHASDVKVIPLVGPSAVLLALMASGMNGQRFAFHGYLPSSPDGRAQALRNLEAESRASDCTQIFIETPYRNVAMLASIAAALAPQTRVCVAVDLTLPTESIATRAVHDWRGHDPKAYAKRPAIFLLEG
jgi:16S rRNA (cytidine1402-2'-O)-methyltransferase